MFFVFNKEKIISFTIAFSTVAILLLISAVTIQQPENITASSSTIIMQNRDNQSIQKNIICGE